MRYKYKNSKERKVISIEDVKGSIFVYRNKKELISSKGIVLTSLEALKENKNNITHWTPNVFRYGSYKDDKRKITEGHYEENLKQINTFFLDFDNNNISESDILSVSYEMGFMPTLILKSERGYQAYYVLKEPAYVNKNTDFKVIEVAKKISNNIRNYFIREKLLVDRLCNHFGIARFPTEENIVYFNKDNLYNFSDWLDWSIKEDDRLPISNKNFYIITGNQGIKQIDEKWFALLLNAKKVRGTKDLMGRNNIIFTLALACYSSGLSQEEAEDKLSVFNDNLDESLKNNEYLKTINSAYSSRYTGASKEYILYLCKKWVDDKLTIKDLFYKQVWVKFKKPRTSRKRSHFEEWEKDVLSYISSTSSVYIEIKKKDIIEKLSIPKRSLDTVLNNLKNKKIIFYKSTSGRLGGIKLALIKNIYLHTINLISKVKENYFKEISNFFGVKSDELVKVVANYEANNYFIQGSFSVEDVGKVLII